MKHVILGNGPAGVIAAEAIRRKSKRPERPTSNSTAPVLNHQMKIANVTART